MALNSTFWNGCVTIDGPLWIGIVCLDSEACYKGKFLLMYFCWSGLKCFRTGLPRPSNFLNAMQDEKMERPQADPRLVFWGSCICCEVAHKGMTAKWFLDYVPEGCLFSRALLLFLDVLREGKQGSLEGRKRNLKSKVPSGGTTSSDGMQFQMNCQQFSTCSMFFCTPVFHNRCSL